MNKNKSSIREYVIGCDIGGTFTDFVLLDKRTGKMEISKCLTTPANPADGIMDGLQGIAKKIPGFLEETKTFIHGTTLLINAIIEKKGVKTGLITTKGFKDILEMRTEMKYDIFDLNLDFPPPIVPRYLRKELDERIYSDGRVLKGLNHSEAEDVVRELVEQGVQSIAVVLLHSYINSDHERVVNSIISEKYPKIAITISSDLLPEIREYERTSTTVLNSYIKPIAETYLKEILERLKLLGYREEFFMMLSSGGITSLETSRNFPIRIVESGPVAGAMACVHYGEYAGIDNILSFDMGGTTAKSCLIKEGVIEKVSTYEVARVHRFKKGSGYPVQVPVIDMLEIGAGGGSIAKVSKMGLLQVGPESAGADPGPVCYSRGATNPTVTDADLLLGYLDPRYFLGGEIQLDKEAAEKAMDKVIAKPLGITLKKAAWGIHELINETMVSAAKIHIAEKGGDISKLTIIAFGGAGPVHAYNFSKKLGVRKIVIPANAGVYSAFGFFLTPFSYDLTQTYKMSIETATFSKIEEAFQVMEKQGHKVLKDAVKTDSFLSLRSIDCRYIGQGFEINVALPSKDFNSSSKKEIIQLYEDNYQRIYGRIYPGIGIEILNLRVNVKVNTPPFFEFKKITKEKEFDTIGVAIKGVRKAYSPLQNSFIDFTVYDRNKLFPGAKFDGPAIIEEKEATTIADSDCKVSVDDFHSISISY